MSPPLIKRVNLGFTHWCPGCSDLHFIPVGNAHGPTWRYNGNPVAPTFAPDLVFDWPWGDRGEIDRCHYILSDGRIFFCQDSTHPLKGQDVALPALPLAYRDPKVG